MYIQNSFALNSSVKLLSGCTQLQHNVQSDSTEAKGKWPCMWAMNHKALRQVLDTDTKCLNPVINKPELFHQARHLFCLFVTALVFKTERSGGEGHRVFVLPHGERGWRSSKRKDVEPSRWKKVVGAFCLQQKDAGCVRHRQRRWGLINTLILTLKSPMTGLCPEEGHSVKRWGNELLIGQ